MPWLDRLDFRHPCWRDCRDYLRQFDTTSFPNCTRINALLPGNVTSQSGKPIRFVPADTLDEEGYEHRIYTSGRVSTRNNDWHDLFNAMIWIRFPRIKIAMNTMHYHALPQQEGGRRGALRDALTLFDECGVIVFSSDKEFLDALRHRDWTAGFRPKNFDGKSEVAIAGHAMLEKFLAPYKAITAKALYVLVDDDFLARPRDEQLSLLDQALAERIIAGELLTCPASLCPLPLAGIPGWWTDTQQDKDFYNDERVFRAPPDNLQPAALIRV